MILVLLLSLILQFSLLLLKLALKLLYHTAHLFYFVAVISRLLRLLLRRSGRATHILNTACGSIATTLSEKLINASSVVIVLTLL